MRSSHRASRRAGDVRTGGVVTFYSSATDVFNARSFGDFAAARQVGCPHQRSGVRDKSEASQVRPERRSEVLGWSIVQIHTGDNPQARHRYSRYPEWPARLSCQTATRHQLLYDGLFNSKRTL